MHELFLRNNDVPEFCFVGRLKSIFIPEVQIFLKQPTTATIFNYSGQPCQPAWSPMGQKKRIA